MKISPHIQCIAELKMTELLEPIGYTRGFAGFSSDSIQLRDILKYQIFIIKSWGINGGLNSLCLMLYYQILQELNFYQRKLIILLISII